MTFNQILFLENIERIAGVLSFSKRFVGKNYVSTLNIDVSSAFFCFESIKSSTRAFSWGDKLCFRQMRDWVS